MMARNWRKKIKKIEKPEDNQNIKQDKNSRYLNILLLVWFLESCALGPNLISQFLLPPIIRTLFAITSVLVMVSLPGRIQFKKQNSVNNLIIIAGLLIYNLGLIISFNDIKNLDILINRLIISVTLIVAYLCMEEEIFVKCMDAYCKFMTFFSISAIIVSAVVLIAHLPPVNEFVAPEGRVYQNYIIGFVEAEVDTLSGFKRAGSFYDEPGTFAVFLIPALFWTMLVRPSTVIFISLFTALLLTFSIGGWMSFGVSLVYVIKLYPDVIKKYRTMIISIFFVLGVFTCLNIILTFLDLGWLSGYFDYKFTGEGTINSVSSAEIRQNEIETFFTLLGENPAGYGIRSPQIPIFSVGVLASPIEAGFLGALGYFIAIMGMVAILIENLISKKIEQSRAVVSILGGNLSMLIMSFQRIDLFTFYTGIFLLSFMMNCALVEEAKVLAPIIQSEQTDLESEESSMFEDTSSIKTGISKLIDASKSSRIYAGMTQLFGKVKESKIVGNVSKLFGSPKKPKPPKKAQSPTLSKTAIRREEQELADVLKELTKPKK